MMQGTRGIKQHFRRNCRVGLLMVLLFWTLTGMAQSHIDLLIVVDEDGIGYTAQQTLLADGELIVSRLPSGRNTLSTVFSGSGSAVYRRAHETDPDKLTLLSGTVFTRFRHRFDSTEDTSAEFIQSDNAPVRKATLHEFEITMADTQSLTSRISWILPPNLELLGYHTDERSARNPSNIWRKDGQMITFEQTAIAPAQLTLEYRVHASSISRANACLASLGPSEWCSPDIDRDGVPDYRDICIDEAADDTPQAEGQTRILSDRGKGADPFQRHGNFTINRADSLGCGDDALVVLPQIQFESGQTYLNSQARSTLDKVATALSRLPDVLYQVGTHTDNAGYMENNLALSQDRADAIRHYLMLRGLGPNQIQARGYGETSPAHDNNNAEGRRANRRVELQRLN
ncbi:MAG: OmpA family protein [Granulosicoccus sp.]